MSVAVRTDSCLDHREEQTSARGPSSKSRWAPACSCMCPGNTCRGRIPNGSTRDRRHSWISAVVTTMTAGASRNWYVQILVLKRYHQPRELHHSQVPGAAAVGIDYRQLTGLHGMQYAIRRLREQWSWRSTLGRRLHRSRLQQRQQQQRKMT